MPISYWRKLLVDRIAITVVIGGVDLYGFVYGQLFAMQDEQEQLFPCGRIRLVKKKYVTRLDFYPVYKKSDRRRIADITIGANKTFDGKSLHRHFTLTLYPSKFKVDEFDQFKEVLETLLPDFKYSKLFETGKVNYLELAADSFSHVNHSFIAYRKYCKDSSIYKREDGTLGTLYLGSRNSDMRFRIYDKRHQLKDTGQLVDLHKYSVHTRFEAVLRRLGCTPAMLDQIENPFTKLHIADPGSAVSASIDPLWQECLAKAKIDGMPKALCEYTQPQRKKYRAILMDSQVYWWKPESVWKGLPEALAVLDP
jgi:hypothetical protein